MSEPVGSDDTGTDQNDTRKTKRVRQTCITMFVVFMIVLFSFGRSPLGKVGDQTGYRIDIDFISVLGIVMGVAAVVFLALSFRRILQLTTIRKMLGLLGCAGLIVHTALALFLPVGGAMSQPVGAGGKPPLAQSGAEEWVIHGKPHKITSTYLLRLPQGLQYTVEYPYQFHAPPRNMDDGRALDIAFPLMAHVYMNDLHKRKSVTKLGEGVLQPTHIGIVLYEEHGEGRRGYRVALTLEQIKHRMQQGTAATAPMQDN